MPRRVHLRWHKGAWCADVGPHSPKTGRRTRVYFREIPDTPKGRRAAEAALESYLKDRDKREAQAAHDPSHPRLWEGIIRPYLAHIEALVDAGKLAERTLKTHNERLKRLLDFEPAEGPFAGVKLGQRLAAGLDEDDAARLVAGLREQGCGPRRVDGILRSADAAFNWAAKPVAGRTPKRILLANPFAGYARERVPRKGRKLPTRAEFAAFLRAARVQVEAWTPVSGRCSGCVRAGRLGAACRRSHNRRALFDRAVLLLCRVQFHVGTRPDELCGATWGEVSMPEGGMSLPGWTARHWRDDRGLWWGRLVVFGKTSRAKGELRRIAVPPRFPRAIERLGRAGLHGRWIFPRLGRGGALGGRWDSTALATKVRPWREAAGLGSHFVLYALRHGMYTRAVHDAGLTADQAGAVGGTGAETVRSTYLHADDRAIFEHARRMDRQAGRRAPG
jgi:integrase